MIFPTNEAECEALLPFTLSRSHGGPYDDAAFLSDFFGDVPLVALLGGSEIAPTRQGEARLHAFSGVLVVA